jgi:hypothetical protein
VRSFSNNPPCAAFLFLSAAQAVIVRGRNLQLIDASLASEHCEELREFDPDRYAMPDDDAALIESIKIHTESREAMAKAEAEVTGEKRH